MRIHRVLTNETCNQNCWFCNARRPAEDPAFIARPAVRRRIDEARAGDAREIVLTGGEPTARSDIADLVQRAAEGGARVVLETNAALIDESRARALAAAGLGIARVQMVAWGEDADTITRDAGGFTAAVRGIRALAAAGVAVEITTPIVRRNLDLIAALPREIAAAELPITTLVLVVPTTAPDTSELAPLGDVALAVGAVADAARRVGVTVRLDPATYVPPCIFEKAERVTHLFALNRGNSSRPGYVHVAECEACLVRDRCPGFPEAVLFSTHPAPIRRELSADVADDADGEQNESLSDPDLRDLRHLRIVQSGLTIHPITEHRVRRRLTVVSSVEEQIARELVGRDELRHSAYGHVTEYTVRVNFHCNQSCEFCFVSTHLPPAKEAEVRAAVERAGREGAVLVLSGGEPTLNPRLVEYVKLAKDLGARAVELQTNAIRLADPVLTSALVDAGLEQAMVSLHGCTPEVSDGITGAPGTFVSTLRGIDELTKTDIRVRLNFVFCQANRRDFPRFIDFVAARWPKVAIVFSFVGSHTDVIPRTTALIPSFTEIMPSLLEGLERARAAGLDVCGFDSMCGLPLCMVPADQRGTFTEMAVSPDGGGGEFVKGDVCAQCSEGYRCYGIRRGYAELYGTSELRPLGNDSADAAVEVR